MDGDSYVTVFDHPNELAGSLPFSQGNNSYGRNGTCALADTAVWAQIAGSKNTENDVVGYCVTHTNDRGVPLCSSDGGVFPRDIPKIWGRMGMPAHLDYSKNLETLAEAIESGHAVSVGINAGKLWEKDNPENLKLFDPDPDYSAYGDGGANHQIGILSVERDIYGNLSGFYINDTGRSLERDSCRRVSVKDFWDFFNVRGAVATISDKPVW